MFAYCFVSKAPGSSELSQLSAVPFDVLASEIIRCGGVVGCGLVFLASEPDEEGVVSVSGR